MIVHTKRLPEKRLPEKLLEIPFSDYPFPAIVFRRNGKLVFIKNEEIDKLPDGHPTKTFRTISRHLNVFPKITALLAGYFYTESNPWENSVLEMTAAIDKICDGDSNKTFRLYYSWREYISLCLEMSLYGQRYKNLPDKYQKQIDDLKKTSRDCGISKKADAAIAKKIRLSLEVLKNRLPSQEQVRNVKASYKSKNEIQSARANLFKRTAAILAGKTLPEIARFCDNMHQNTPLIISEKTPSYNSILQTITRGKVTQEYATKNIGLSPENNHAIEIMSKLYSDEFQSAVKSVLTFA
jgi:hypothetical protein